MGMLLKTLMENDALSVALLSPDAGRPPARPSFVLPGRGAAVFLSANGAGSVAVSGRALLVQLRGRMTGLVDRFREDRVLSAESIAPAARLRRELRVGDEAAILIAEATALELIAQLSRCDQPPPREAEVWVSELRTRLGRDLSAAPSITDVALSLGTTSSHLLRTFRRLTGESIGEYRRRQQIHRAIDLLLETGLPMQEIAYRAGFYDQAHFARVFKQQIGVTPSSFRRHSETAR
jgi:AraC-like DNA-binding protein